MTFKSVSSLGSFRFGTLILLIMSSLLMTLTAHAQVLAPRDPQLQEVLSWRPAQYWSFQRATYAELDPAGDLILARMMAQFPFDIVKIMAGLKKIQVPEQEMGVWEASSVCRAKKQLDHQCVEKGYRARLNQDGTTRETNFVEGVEPPLLRNQLLYGFVRVIQEERHQSHIEPWISKQPRWSDDFYSQFTNKGNYTSIPRPEDYGYIVDLFQKPLVALFLGATSRFLPTNHDVELSQWIVSRPIESITLLDVFRKAYRLQQGNLHHTFLSIENVFSRRWRHAHREDLQMTRRLRPFTNWESGRVNDNFGSWYHFWGTAYYGLIAGQRKALWAANVEHQGSTLLGSDDFEKQEHFVNIAGALLGSDLAEVIKKNHWQSMETLPFHLKEESYRNQEFHSLSRQK